MSGPDADLGDAVRHIRDRAIRQAMALANQISIDPDAYSALGPEPTATERRALRIGHAQARRQLYDALDRLIATEAAAAARGEIRVTQPGYTSDGLED